MKLAGGIALILLALFLFFGFMRSTVTVSATTMLALVVAVMLPAAFGVALLRSRFRAGERSSQRRDQLLNETIAAEILRLAAEREGRLTVVEIVTEMALPSDVAQSALDMLVQRDLADIAVTDSGVLVYTFRDIQRLGEKARARGILE